ncbi:hypothetical protein [Planomonospora venezuelensis]|uniref:hypothetical protein n=1 Tax=Planomonospora venezuelensis TaxID=1999 RepID=UPI0031EED395
MSRKRTAAMITAAFFAIGAAQLLGTGPAAAATLDGGGARSLLHHIYDFPPLPRLRAHRLRHEAAPLRMIRSQVVVG